MGVNILLLGGGGREHALAWKLCQSTEVAHVYVSPGNAGTENGEKMSNTVVDVKQHDVVAAWCKHHQVTLVVVGPEDPLAAGIADNLTKQGILCFGPSSKAAEIESSKEFAKSFMMRHAIPTAQWGTFTDYEAAENFINSAGFPALVVKASGLAAGKGVMVAADRAEACQTARRILKDRCFGEAGATVVVEELLDGDEISVLAFSDGHHIACMPPSQDHKRLLDGDEGLNTGGMGAYCPCHLVTQSDLEVIKRDILQKAVDGMKNEGRPFVGVLYAGLMMTKDGPKVLEFNCRFGDPETQVVLPLLKSDLYPILVACCQGKLNSIQPVFLYDRHTVAVVTVSKGYPGPYQKGLKITGVESVEVPPTQLVFHAGTRRDNGHLVTSGGRVLATVAIDTSLDKAASKALKAAGNIRYDGCFFRRDIALKSLKRSCGLTYSDSGVDVSAGEDLVSLIKPFAASTARPGCQPDLGQFGGVFNLEAAGYMCPLLVSGTDGVGTKLKIAQSTGSHEMLGIDLVAMCVNDVLCHAAEPLFFLDYFATGRLDVEAAAQVVKGVAEGCHQAGCALIGGETAEMPGMYCDGEYDLAGFTVGAVQPEHYLPQIELVQPGDAVIGVASSGLHSNGFSLVRAVVERCGLAYQDQCPFSTGQSLGESLLCPTRIYVKSVLPLLRSGKVKVVAHITGGGLTANIVRVLPEGTGVQIDATKWNMPAVFSWLNQQGNIESGEMSRTFNCGVGMVLITSEQDAKTAVQDLINAGDEAWAIGSVINVDTGGERVFVKNLEQALHFAWSASVDVPLKKIRLTNGSSAVEKKQVGVLISGTGTNLQALIDHTQNIKNKSKAQICLVVSNKAEALGLKRAREAGIATKVLNHKDYGSRQEFDQAVSAELVDAGIEIVCLAGFMRILSGWFVREWRGRLLNIHPSLLPAFKGMHAHRQALDAGVTVTGCSVHFVAEEVDGGAIVTQEAVPVLPDDTEDILSERVKLAEHRAFPRALDLLAADQVELGEAGKLVWKA